MALTKIDDRGLKTPIDLLDNEKIRFGTGNDLELYHDGSNYGFILNNTGDLVIKNDNSSTNAIRIRSKGDEEDIVCNANGAVELYYDNEKKFYTQSWGATVADASATTAWLELVSSDGVCGYLVGQSNAGSGSEKAVSFYNAAGNETLLRGINNGAVELYYNNSKKVETVDGGLLVQGYVSLQGGSNAQVYIEDNGKLNLGSSHDLQLYHDGTNSIIDNTPGTGTFYVRGDALYLQTSQSTPETYIAMDSGTGPRLYHNNIKCFETNNNGIEVFGPEGGDAIIRLSADERDDDADKWRLHAEADSTQFKIENYNSGAWETSIRAVGDGTVELYFNNDVKLETLTDGLKSKDNTKFCWGDGFDLQIYHNGTDSKIINSTGNLTINATATEPGINITPNGAVDLYHNNIKTFETTSTGTKTTGINLITGDVAASYIAQIFHDGANTNRYGLTIQCGADDSAGTNYAIGIHDGNGDGMGFITFTSGTVTYGAFTAHHPCIVPDSENPSDSSNAYPYGTLLETISIEYTQKNGSDTERGIRYKVQKTQSANSRKVLGAYGSSMNGGPDGQTNEHQALILGDGHILVNNAGGNIEVGDGICSSATAGIGQKATANPSMIIGIAQEAVTFTGSETKLVAVQYGLQQFIPWT